jgi:hypothetical protein
MLQQFKDLYTTPSLASRVAIGKTAGFVIGLACFIGLPLVWAGSTLMLQWGVLLWYTTIGAFIGMFAEMKHAPIINLPLPWWFGGIWVGGWMNFILTLFAYDLFVQMMDTMFSGQLAGYSPFWFVLEGAIIGLIIAGLTVKYGGEPS